ncbi:hypothetical protein MCP_2387 [Methanocella paludicola SANAE]|uniref:Uncharacterized protein n=2 Tax=Methanocella TaxID=570266 RepID=D1Z187_METPS|nr:hypothetical protein MCP_2387 [Methanocella paludicola SANAE]
MDGAALGLPKDVAVGIFDFLVDNDKSLDEVIEALALCRKVKELETSEPLVYNALMDMLNKYLGYVSLAVSPASKKGSIVGPAAKTKINKKVSRAKKSK